MISKLRIAHLKIKIKSLAAESRIIRKDEIRLRKHYPFCEEQRISLYFHRTKDLRTESRAAGLAYGFLRGRTYRFCEVYCKTPVPRDVANAVVGIVQRFCTSEYARSVDSIRMEVDKWLDGKGPSASVDEQEVSNSENGFNSHTDLQPEDQVEEFFLGIARKWAIKQIHRLVG